MQAFLLERLFPTGWRRGGELFFRLSDATREADRLVTTHELRGVRILPVRILSDAVVELFANEEQGATS